MLYKSDTSVLQVDTARMIASSTVGRQFCFVTKFRVSTHAEVTV